MSSTLAPVQRKALSNSAGLQYEKIRESYFVKKEIEAQSMLHFMLTK